MLSKLEVLKIKQLIGEDYSASYIAKYLNTSLTTVYRIKNTLTKKDKANKTPIEKTPKKLLKYKKLILKIRRQGVSCKFTQFW